ncbi:MAG: hypothetical protein ABF823_12760 [Acetobacter syzygii]|uniref:hypothetical protein n=1 Tax=Acetobacter syzygii TaxID=146476 RepID=UPI0039EC9533
MRQLPYPGYSWPITQHAAGFNENDIRNMLSCALPFEGKSGVGKKITSLMIASGILTENVRDGIPDAWRDYQQLLAELGFIVSTRICNSVRLTSVAKSFVAGEVNYSSLMSMQSFRYQYPNGQKYTLQANQKSIISETVFKNCKNQIDLHICSGVLIRPAPLILRVLFELFISGDDKPLTLEEVRDFLLPSRKNDEWYQCVSEIKSARNDSGWSGNPSVDKTRRNLQDWFKLLRENIFFSTDGSRYIKLSQFSLRNMDSVERILCYCENIESFWIPTSSSLEEQFRWFSWYGQFGDLITTVEKVEYSQNVSEAVFADDDDSSQPVTLPISLSEIDEDALLKKKKISFNIDQDEIARSVIQGEIRRYAKHILHDEIVAEFAKKFKAQGAMVVSDPNTVDLLVIFGNASAMFEVKTVNYSNMRNRIRLALGQVEEYSFRLLKEKGLNPDRGIILNRSINNKSWQAEFLAEHMNVGIISRTSSGISIIPPRKRNWDLFWK